MIVVLRSIVLLILVASLTACSALSDPVLPTLRPTFTVSPEPSATFTQVFNATATLAPVVAVTATPGPSPTRPIGAIPTQPIFTATATFVNYAPGTLEIEYFTTSASVVKPGDIVTLFWSARGVDKATIFRIEPDGERGREWNVNRAGSLDVKTDTEDRGTVDFLLVIGNPDSHLEQTLSIPTGCQEVWFFDPQPDGCPVMPPTISTMVQQPFEHGQMIWVEAEHRIYVLFNDGQQPMWATYPDEFKEGDPDRDNAIVPPPGLFQPIRGFGLVWRARERVRDRLGWATQSEFPYDGALQGDALTQGGAMYLKGRDSNIFGLFSLGESWRLITQ